VNGTPSAVTPSDLLPGSVLGQNGSPAKSEWVSREEMTEDIDLRMPAVSRADLATRRSRTLGLAWLYFYSLCVEYCRGETILGRANGVAYGQSSIEATPTEICQQGGCYKADSAVLRVLSSARHERDLTKTMSLA
jgi:hypothetical protein